MEKAIIGKKIGMTQIFDADGKVIPVTVIEAGPCTVVQKRPRRRTATTPFSSATATWRSASSPSLSWAT